MFNPQKIDLSLGTRFSGMNSSRPRGLYRKPPISTGSALDFGTTRRFAPMLRSSPATRSPTSSIAPSMAVATAEPMATAAMVSIFRRGDWRIDWLRKRRNIYWLPPRKCATPANSLSAGITMESPSTVEGSAIGLQPPLEPIVGILMAEAQFLQMTLAPFW